MRIQLVLATCLGIVLSIKGMSQGVYAVSNISQHLLKDADVIKRVDDLRYEITEGNKARIYRKVAYTILSEKGDGWAEHGEWYSKLRSVESFDGTLYDGGGKKLKSLKKSDLRDESGGGGGAMVDDIRIKSYSFYYKVYPYTIEYDIEIDNKNTLFFPM